MVLFGGSGASSDLADTWTFNGTTWTRLSPATSPPARDSASMAYDPATGNMVLFGGEDNSANLADTWTFNGTTWTRLSPATSPPARWYASMAYDPASGDILLFGGSASSGDLSDTWTFNGTTWTQLSPATSPPARDSASMAYDPADADIVLFGGSASSGDLSDTWTFDGTTWTQLSPATSPPARDSASMAYDQVTGDIVLFGGEDNSANLSDTWTFVQSTVTLTQGSPISALVAYGAGYSGHSLAVTNSTRTVSYSEVTSADSTDVVVSGTGAISAATSLAPGIYTVAGSDRDANDDTGTWTFSLIVGKASQSITFTSTAPSNATVGTTYTVIATGGASGNAVTFSTMSACTVSGSTVSFIGVGPCVIDADQAGNADYLMATQVQQTIAVGKASQSISFTSTAPSNATVGATYTVTAKGGASGNAVTFHASSDVRRVGLGGALHRRGRMRHRSGPGRQRGLFRSHRGTADDHRRQGFPDHHLHLGGAVRRDRGRHLHGDGHRRGLGQRGHLQHDVDVHRVGLEGELHRRGGVRHRREPGRRRGLSRGDAGSAEVQGCQGHLQDRPQAVSDQSGLRARAGRASVSHRLTAVLRLDAEREGDHQGVRRHIVHDHAPVGQGNMHALAQEAQAGHLPPRRHLRRQHGLQGFDFGQGGLHRHQVTSRRSDRTRGGPGGRRQHRP